MIKFPGKRELQKSSISGKRETPTKSRRKCTYRPMVEGLENRVLLSNGFIGNVQVPLPVVPQLVSTGDFDQDGNLDLLTISNLAPFRIDVAFGRGDGTFLAPLNELNLSFGVLTISDLALPDWNGDTFQDLVIAGPGFVQIALNSGSKDRTSIFLPPTSFSSGGAFPLPDQHSMALADLDGDGRLDVALSNLSPTGQAVVMLHNPATAVPPLSPDGLQAPLFFSEVPPPVTSAPTASTIDVGDFNGDGLNDLLLGNNGLSNPAVVLPNLGNGRFGYGQGANFPPNSLAQIFVKAYDINHDGKLDIVTPGSVELGTGTGLAFLAGQNISPNASFLPVVPQLIDFNGDGNRDFITGSPVPNSIAITLGTGSGPFFGQSANYYVGGNPISFVAGDYNNDGILDLAVANQQFLTGAANPIDVSINSICILLGAGNGTLVLAPSFQLNSVNISGAVQQPSQNGTTHNVYANAVLAVDINQDQRLDLLTQHNDNSATPVGITALLGAAKGNFAPAQTLGFQGVALAAGDFNNDGFIDLVSSGGVILGDGTGAYFTPPASLTRFNITPLLGVAPGTFNVGVGDFNRDGNLDFMSTTATGVREFFGTGDGFFLPPFDLSTGTDPVSITVADLNGDGLVDVITSDYGLNQVSVLLGNGDGTFKASTQWNVVKVAPPVPPVSPVAKEPNFVLVDDFNHDAKPDLAVANGADDTVSILMGNGDGTFLDPINFTPNPPPDGTVLPTLGRKVYLTTGDFYARGQRDLAVVNPDINLVTILKGNGDGFFDLPNAVSYVISNRTNQSGSYIVTGDFNGDGATDLAVTSALLPSVALGAGDPPMMTILMNRKGTTVTLASSAPTVPVGQSLTLTATVATNFGTAALPTGTVSFFEYDRNPFAFASATLSGGTATINVSNLSVGTHHFSVRYDANATSLLQDWSQVVTVQVTAGSPLVAGTPGGSTTNNTSGSNANNNNSNTTSTPAAGSVASWGTPSTAYLVTGTQIGAPNVIVYSAQTRAVVANFFAYDPRFNGGVRVATGDVSGDGIPDIITAPGPGGGPDIHVYDGKNGNMIRQFFAYDPRFAGGQFVTAGDVNGDSFADIIIGADQSGGPNVIVFSGKDGSVLYNFFAYDPRFIGGVRVAVGDVNGDGKDDIIAGAGAGGGPNVSIFSGANGSLLNSFFAYDPRFNLGIFVAAGDVNGDGKADVITGAGAGGGPNVSVFDGASGRMIQSFFAYDPRFVGGVRVGAVDRNGDGKADIVTTTGNGGGPDVRSFNGLNATLIDSFFAYNPLFAGGVFIGGGAA